MLLAPVSHTQQIDGTRKHGAIDISLYLVAPLYIITSPPELHKYVFNNIFSIIVVSNNASCIEEKLGIDALEQAVKLCLTFHESILFFLCHAGKRSHIDCTGLPSRWLYFANLHKIIHTSHVLKKKM